MRKRTWVALAVALTAGAVGCGSGGDDNGGSVSDNPSPAGSAAAPAAATTTKAAPAVVLSPKDIKLTVDVKKKECFGSAGCNVQWKIDVALDKTKLKQGSVYTVTYEVRGVEDGPQISTLTIEDKDTFTQDDFAAGSIPRKSTKLTAVATDVEEE